MLVNPVNEAAVAPKSTSVEPIVTLSFANLALVILPSCTVPATSANEAVACALKVVALAATSAFTWTIELSTIFGVAKENVWDKSASNSSPYHCSPDLIKFVKSYLEH